MFNKDSEIITTPITALQLKKDAYIVNNIHLIPLEMKRITLVVTIFFTVFLLSCKNSKNQTNNVDKLQTTAQAALGDDTECQSNKSNTYVLCQKASPLESSPGNLIKFIVYNSEGEVVYEDEVSNGSVKWSDEDDKIELFYTPGIMAANQTNDDYTYIYDLTNKTKTKKVQ